jgi:glutamate racemase
MKRLSEPIRIVAFKSHLYLLSLLLVFCIILVSCKSQRNIDDVILNDRNSFYFIDVHKYPERNGNLPVGIFDSGTGGLATLNDILRYRVPIDSRPGGKLPPDSTFAFKNESFIFLADLANMPYGNYPAEKNTALLIEHILKDVQFLLGSRYYHAADASGFMSDKSPVKAIVIACNTATAYGLDSIRSFLARGGLGIGVIGVIDAGAKGALSVFESGEEGSIAVLATDATVRSGAYIKTITALKEKSENPGNIQVFQQAGTGIAEAIDENRDYFDRSASGPRKTYKGPSEKDTGEMRIDMSKWKQYGFKMTERAMLFEGDSINPYNLQINSVENYISFHLVSLLAKMKNNGDVKPVQSVVLACTHYPFFGQAFRNTLIRLRDYSENGEYIYRSLIDEDFIIINPAEILAHQLYEFLNGNDMLSKPGEEKSEFYISVPNVSNRNAEIREDGSFTYEYKYGRTAGRMQEYVKCVPFSNSVIQRDIVVRLSTQVPYVFDRIVRFNHNNPKTDFLNEPERIKHQ